MVKNLDSSYNAMLYRNCSKVVQAVLYRGGSFGVSVCDNFSIMKPKELRLNIDHFSQSFKDSPRHLQQLSSDSDVSCVMSEYIV